MNPDANQQPTSSTPASLPAVPVQPQPVAAAPAPGVAAPVPHTGLKEQVTLQAQALVAQYQQDPYKLSVALQQLKANYIAQQFNISAKSAEE